ncbi:hypothetical protein ENSA5_37560 [Enhygromyxa salina]|uniref:Uncharacterized protein n=1 Tax=Enhygromyxa salina TaxID=215803 RepID=A0A2S9XSR4_9BACT|nr:hypothetical protein [Enhygromyxa salina]PRP95886.1 hypothetical protein ENSA5_37560 [Enhygromyxa salina]
MMSPVACSASASARASTHEGETRIEVGEVGRVSLAGVPWDVRAREAISSWRLGV